MLKKIIIIKYLNSLDSPKVSNLSYEFTSPTSVRFSWMTNNDDIKSILSIFFNNQKIFSIETFNTNYEVKNLEGKLYSFTVQAVNSNGLESAVAEVSMIGMLPF